jgi:hypothetical protein
MTAGAPETGYHRIGEQILRESIGSAAGLNAKNLP